MIKLDDLRYPFNPLYEILLEADANLIKNRIPTSHYVTVPSRSLLKFTFHLVGSNTWALGKADQICRQQLVS